MLLVSKKLSRFKNSRFITQFAINAMAFWSRVGRRATSLVRSCDNNKRWKRETRDQWR